MIDSGIDFKAAKCITVFISFFNNISEINFLSEISHSQKEMFFVIDLIFQAYLLKSLINYQ